MFFGCLKANSKAALGATAMTSLFDRSLRHNGQLLLIALARKEPQAPGKWLKMGEFWDIFGYWKLDFVMILWARTHKGQEGGVI